MSQHEIMKPVNAIVLLLILIVLNEGNVNGVFYMGCIDDALYVKVLRLKQ